ncbi:MAG TPA: sugar kinase [Dinghuibacter sp.]|uniref:sugar kinase n=1 Tax=Dinghuibacter sp. TaxID=2024697 RepID=UPI002C5C6EB3|nr:sugar kinase [Dinghuibacter sp.]HTJ13363.1 sugar kinase [Dinghuibacter sp.]
MTSIVVCFGEILLRMSPALEGHWLQDARMPVFVGGAEANVACALASWNQPVAYCTAMPDNYLSRDMAAWLEGRGVDTSPVLWTGQRVGAYYLPQGSDLQHAGVIYDRAGSAFAGLAAGAIDWDLVLQDAGWFHFSAISPALTPSVAALCREGLEAATRKGLSISVDLNYRSKLWQYGVSPVSVMPSLVEYCDVVMGNLWAAESLLGIPVDKDVHQQGSKQRYLDHSRSTSEAILARYPRCRRVAHTFRFEKVSEGLHYYATLFSRDGGLHVSREFRTDAVVDKVGSGDCFMGGLIYGGVQGWDPQRTIDYAAAAAIGKLQEKGDSTRQTVAQVLQTIQQHA